MPSKYRYKVLLTALLCLLHHISPARPKHYNFVNITEKDGFVPNKITCILEDSKGYIWFGTRQGLNRYDGYTIERFTNRYDQTNTLSDNFIFGLAEDKEGNIWIATIGGGLDWYNTATKKFTHLQHTENKANTLLQNKLSSVYADKKDQIWIGYAGAGWAVFDRRTGKIENYRARTSFINGYGINAADNPVQFAEDKNGHMWIASSYGLYCHDKANNITTYLDRNRNNDPQCDNLFTSIFQSDDSTLWLGTWAAGLKKFNINTKQFSQYTYDGIDPSNAIHNIVLSIAPKSENELWLATADKGLGIFDIASGRFTFLPHDPEDPQSPLAGECNKVLKDRTGILWAGYKTGISRYLPRAGHFSYVPIQKAPAAFKNHITPTAFYKDTATGLLYLGCSPGIGLYVINEKTGTQEVFNIPATGGKSAAHTDVSVTSILQRNRDELLLQTSSGLCTFNKRSRKAVLSAIKDQDGRMPWGSSGLVMGRHGYWYNAGFNNGYYFIDSSLRTAIHYCGSKTSPVQYNTNDVSVLLEENDTTVWIAKRDIGLCIFNPVTNRVKKLNNAINASLYSPAMIQVDEKHFWLPSYEHGVFCITRITADSFNCRQYGEQDGLSSDYGSDITTDSDGNIWVATDKGPAVLPTAATKFISLNKSYFSVQVEPYYPVIYRAPDNSMYLGCRLEYARWRPDSVLTPTQAPPLYLVSLRIFDKEWNDTIDLNSVKHITLPYNKNFISASFAALDHTVPTSVQYAWKMEGIDKNWVNGGNIRNLSYSGIPPGSYQLHIRATNSMGAGEEISIQITIEPPFWKTWWFISLAIVAVAALVLAVFRYRIAEVRREARIKSEFNRKMAEVEMKALRAQMNPHFLFNCLNSINRYIVKNETIKASGYLTKFSKLIRLILDNSSGDRTTLDSEINLLRLYIEMESMRFDGKFTYSIDVDKTLACDTISIPSMIIQPYIENAIWHGLLNKGDTGHLSLRFIDKAPDTLEVIIQDDGVGRKKAQELKSKSTLKTKSYGMQITSDRIKVMNHLYDTGAEVEITDADAIAGSTGTIVTLHIPYSLSRNEPGIS